ncbi:MAG: TonB-dependent receptor [Ferruginibacter sp.]|nr:TonB-dependent receptor [Ferruginibacter sp.]
MKKKIFIAAAVIISSTAQGQDSTKLLNEVVITAAKFPLKTSATGKVVNVITKDELQKAGGRDITQLITEKTGVYINGFNSNMGKDKSVYVRGANIAYTLITIDGIPVYDASGIGGNFDLRNMAIDNVERIEILKGSQSTLYGSDAIAGVINIITKKGGNKIVGVNGLASYGSNNTFRGNIGVNGAKDKVDYNINYSNTTTKGINETISTNGDKDGYKQNSVQANVGFKATNKVYLQPFFRYTQINGDIDQGAFTDEQDYTYKQKSTQVGIKTTVDLKKRKLNILYSHNVIDRVFIDDSTKSRNGYDIFAKGIYKGNEHFFETFAGIDVNKNVKLTVGGDFRASNTDQTYSSVGFFGPYKTELGKDSLKQNQVGIYAAANISTQKGFNIELGNRLNIHSEYGSNYVFNINPSYLINNKVKLFANLSSGYRVPSLYQLYSEYGNKQLKPESSINSEIGAQYFSKDNQFNARAVYFNRTIKEVIFFYFNSTTFQSQYINQDKQKDNGLELEAAYTGIKNLSIKSFFNFVDGNISTKTGAGKDTTFFNLLRRPKTSFGVNIGYQATKQFYVSTNIAAFDKREDAYFDNTTFTTKYVTLQSYALLNVYAQYTFYKNKLTLFADVRNILDSDYTEVSGYNTLGTTFFGGLRFNF